MSMSGYTEIRGGTGGLFVATTQGEVLQPLLAQIQAQYRGCKIQESGGVYYTPLKPKSSFWSVSKLDNQDVAVCFWLVAQLCNAGWEVFQVEDGDSLAHFAYHLRLR